MCRHNHVTPVEANLDDGTPVITAQCDMCGMDIPGAPLDDFDFNDLPPLPIDQLALVQAHDRRTKQLRTKGDEQMLAPPNIKREDNGDILWA
jgi:hypothetical protein